MDERTLNSADFDLTKVVAKLGNIKSFEDLTGPNGPVQEMLKQAMETLLKGEQQAHLGYEPYKKGPNGPKNSRNGYSPKTVRTSNGEVEIAVPRDREGTFEPQLVKKYQKTDPKVEAQILSLYGCGLSTRDIAQELYGIYGTEVSPNFISAVTDKIMPEINEWQNRVLNNVYPVLFLDAIFYKVKIDHKIVNKAIYTVLGIDLEGGVEVLGLWTAETEGSKFWMTVLSDLKARGVQDVLIACVDGLKGFPEAISVVFPETQVQLCVVHQIRNSLKYLPSKHQKAFLADLKGVYRAPNLEAAELALDALEEKWGTICSMAIQGWRKNWAELSTYFEFSENIRSMIYTTNAVEAMHRQFRKATKTKGAFTSDDALKKLLYLTTMRAQKSLRRKRGWPAMLAELKITFGDRLP